MEVQQIEPRGIEQRAQLRRIAKKAGPLHADMVQLYPGKAGGIGFAEHIVQRDHHRHRAQCAQ